MFGRKLKQSKQPEPICGCGHHLAFHDRANNTCGHSEALYNKTEEPILDANKNPVRNEDGDIAKVYTKTLAGTSQCGCRQYIGPEHVALFNAPQIHLPQA